MEISDKGERKTKTKHQNQREAKMRDERSKDIIEMKFTEQTAN